MRDLLRLLLVLALSGGFGASCSAQGGGGGGGADGFPGIWRYREGSYSFVNCYTTSRRVDLTRTGFQIVNEQGTLVRINPDGCRFRITPTTARHAQGVTGEECTTRATDVLGNPLTTRYRLKSLVLELRPDDASQMIEVFSLDTEQTSTLGTVLCEISGTNTLDRGP